MLNTLFELPLRFLLFVLAVVGLSLAPKGASADIIDVDVTGVAPVYRDVFLRAEAFWEARIQSYSTELPRSILRKATSLKITAATADIDGAGGILGFAGPTVILMHISPPFALNPTNRAIPAESMMQFDNADMADMEASGILQKVIIHEMGHALGFGTLFQQNDLIGPLGGVGLTQYIGGRYAIMGYRRDINNPYAVFVPLEQRGGPGTALGHWEDMPPFFNQTFTPAFKKEVLTGFACDVDPDTGDLVCPPMFISEATWGAMADLGYEVAGVNDNLVDPPRGSGIGDWEKVNGSGFVPVQGGNRQNVVGFSIQRTNVIGVTRRAPNDVGSKPKTGVKTPNAADPYGLRNHRWVK